MDWVVVKHWSQLESDAEEEGVEQRRSSGVRHGDRLCGGARTSVIGGRSWLDYGSQGVDRQHRGKGDSKYTQVGKVMTRRVEMAVVGTHQKHSIFQPQKRTINMSASVTLTKRGWHVTARWGDM